MIEMGEWIRLKDGRIRQLKWTDGINAQWTRPFGEGLLKDIVKHSKEIIDLIEIGDIVNGERILDITGDYIHTNETNHNKFYLGKHIITILTKELYQANCYTVERKEKC